MFVSRFIAPTIAIIIITAAHIAKHFGMGVPGFLVSPVIDAMILCIAVVIAIVGFKLGWWILVIVFGIALACIYIYFQYEIDIITIMPSGIMMNAIEKIGGYII